MVDVPKNVLPDQEGTSDVKEQDVNTSEEIQEDVIEPSQEEAVQEETETSGEEPVPKGSKTSETQLYSKLKEEREKRRQEQRKREELEEELRLLQTSSATSETGDGVADDEGIRTLTKRLAQLEQKESMRELMHDFPQLADKRDEFDEFREEEENKNIPLRKVAQLFLLEKGLLSGKPARKGLEKPTGGSKAPQPSGVSESDVKRLREQNPRKYIKMIREGKLKAEDIK